MDYVNFAILIASIVVGSIIALATLFYFYYQIFLAKPRDRHGKFIVNKYKKIAKYIRKSLKLTKRPAKQKSI